MCKVVGVPDSEYDYEFVVAKLNNDGNYEWICSSEYYTDEIDQLAKQDGIYIIHNITISNKQKKGE